MTVTGPVGVFDSGLGGLTVVRAIRQECPGLDLVYFGDTARIPYGTKSPETVTRYAREIVAVLRDAGATALVVACNTASAVALPALTADAETPVLGVLEPGARAAAAVTRSGHVAVLGTRATIASGAYQHALHALIPTLAVQQIACPLFVPLVEEQWTDGPVPRLVAEQYLADLHPETDTVILGCTHYPLLAPLLRACLGPTLQLIDSAEATARALRTVLAAAGWQPQARPGAIRVLVSDAPDAFARAGVAFLGEAVASVEWHRW